MQCAPRANGHHVRTDWIAILEVKRDVDFGVAIAGVQEADGLVRDERVRLADALAWDIAFSDSPATMSDRGHAKRAGMRDQRAILHRGTWRRRGRAGERQHDRTRRFQILHEISEPTVERECGG